MSDNISKAKLKAKESIDWEKEAKEYAGSEWNSLTKKEKEDIISDMKKDWERGTHFKEGGLNDDLIHRICKNILKKYDVTKDDKIIEDSIRHEESANKYFTFFYFESRNDEMSIDSKRYYMVVKGYEGFDEYYYDSNVIDSEHSYTIEDVKKNFKNYLKYLSSKIDFEGGGETDNDEEDDDNEDRLQELSDEYDIPTEVIKEYASDRGMEISEIDDLPFQGRFDSEEAYAEDMVEQGAISNLSYYLEMSHTDMRLLAQEEADNRVDNMDDDELLEQAGLDSEVDDYDNAKDEIETLENEISDLKEELDELYEDEDEDTTEGDVEGKEGKASELRDELEEKENELERLEDKLGSYDNRDDLIEKAKEQLRDEYYDDIYDSLEKDAVGYFVNELGYAEEDLAKNNLFSIDYEFLAKELGYDVLYIENGGDVYVFSNYERGGMTYAQGGGIPNNYRGKTTDDIWNMLSEHQRIHFLLDHAEEFNISSRMIPSIANQSWDKLDDNIQNTFKTHTMMGQYANGGVTRKVDLSKYDNIDRIESYFYKIGNYWYVDGYKMKHHAQGVGHTKKEALEDLDHHLSYVTENDEYKGGGNLIGKQYKLDRNKNGRLDSEDFKMIRGEKMSKGGKLKVGDTIYRAWFTDEDGEKGSAIIVATSQKDAERIATKIDADRFSYVSNPIKIKNEEVLFEESREKEPIYKMADGGMMAKGGMTEHGLQIGDEIKKSKGYYVEVTNNNKEYLIDLNKGIRVEMNNEMAKGGDVNLKSDYLSSSDYQKAKKLKTFNAEDWKLDSSKDLYAKVKKKS